MKIEKRVMVHFLLQTDTVYRRQANDSCRGRRELFQVQLTRIYFTTQQTRYINFQPTTSQKCCKHMGYINPKNAYRQSIWSEQLNTTTYLASVLPISFTVSVLPEYRPEKAKQLVLSKPFRSHSNGDVQLVVIEARVPSGKERETQSFGSIHVPCRVVIGNFEVNHSRYGWISNQAIDERYR